LFYSEQGGILILRNIRSYLPTDTA